MEDYENFSPKLALLYQVFRNSIGDIALFETGESLDKIIIGHLLIWIQIVVMIIVFLNFLIAEVSSTYERISSCKETTQYELKAKLNKEVYGISK